MCARKANTQSGKLQASILSRSNAGPHVISDLQLTLTRPSPKIYW